MNVFNEKGFREKESVIEYIPPSKRAICRMLTTDNITILKNGSVIISFPLPSVSLSASHQSFIISVKKN
jgi:hypothetical protein